MRARLLDAPALDLAGQMALDEAVLDSGFDGTTLRLYRWTDGVSVHGATFGYSQRFEDAAVAAPGFALVRRSTGGGVVLHDGDVTFSWVFPWPELAAPSLVYKDLHLAVHLGFKAAGVETRLWSPPGGAAPAGAACFPRPATADLVSPDGRKVLGGALRRRRWTGLYQGSLRREALGVAEAVAARAILDGIAAKFRLDFRREAAFPAELEAAGRLAEKYASAAWNRRR